MNLFQGVKKYWIILLLLVTLPIPNCTGSFVELRRISWSALDNIIFMFIRFSPAHIFALLGSIIFVFVAVFLLRKYRDIIFAKRFLTAWKVTLIYAFIFWLNGLVGQIGLLVNSNFLLNISGAIGYLTWLPHMIFMKVAENIFIVTRLFFWAQPIVSMLYSFLKLFTNALFFAPLFFVVLLFRRKKED